MIARREFIGLGVFGAALGVLSYRVLLAGKAPAESPMVSVAEAYRRADANEILLVDIRRPDEWRDTGIGAPAHPIDMRRDDFLDVLNRVAGPDRSAPIALICARGVRSARLATRLRDAGYTQIIDVPAGMVGSSAGPGWVAAGLPLKPYEALE